LTRKSLSSMVVFSLSVAAAAVSSWFIAAPFRF
jgi:hypothetical protein